MEWKKVKWLIIALLLAVNIFLGISIAFKYTRAIRSEKESLTAAVELAKASLGFTVDKFAHLPRYLYSYTGERDMAAEAETARSIVHGDIQCTEAGGGVFIYNSPGTERVVFRRGGSVEGIVSADFEVNITQCITRAAQNSGLETKTENGQLSFYFLGRPISNGFLSQDLFGEYVSLTATVPLSSDWQRQQKCRSRGEMVLALRNISEQYELGELIKVEAVYYAEARAGTVLELIPAWQAECSGGTVTVSLVDKTLLQSDFN